MGNIGIYIYIYIFIIYTSPTLVTVVPWAIITRSHQGIVSLLSSCNAVRAIAGWTTSTANPTKPNNNYLEYGLFPWEMDGNGWKLMQMDEHWPCLRFMSNPVAFFNRRNVPFEPRTVDIQARAHPTAPGTALFRHSSAGDLGVNRGYFKGDQLIFWDDQWFYNGFIVVLWWF